jgi:hypothetical protein
LLPNNLARKCTEPVRRIMPIGENKPVKRHSFSRLNRLIGNENFNQKMIESRNKKVIDAITVQI